MLTNLPSPCYNYVENLTGSNFWSTKGLSGSVPVVALLEDTALTCLHLCPTVNVNFHLPPPPPNKFSIYLFAFISSLHGVRAYNFLFFD